MRSRLFVLLVLSVCSVDARAQSLVPSPYQDLYAQLASDVASFKSTIDQSWDGSKWPVTFGANLSSADSNRGAALTGPNVGDAVRLELDSLKALGATAVTVHVSFPILYAPFYQNLSDYLQYLSFYTQMAQDVRARRLTLIVETQAVFPSYVAEWNLSAYYNSLSLDQYQRARALMVRTIVDTLQPDYVSVIHEPDTEALQTGKTDIGTLSGSTALLNAILGALRGDPAAASVRIGAGVGTWTPNYADYVNSYAATPVDFIDMHVYPANRDFLTRAIDIADIAASHGKPVGMSEAWLYKVRDNEVGAIDSATILGRDTFAFWAPLDVQFVRAMADLAQFKRLAFMAPFNSGYFHAYLGYDETTATLPPVTLLQSAAVAQAANSRAGTYTSSGFGYASAVLDSPDVVAPAAATGVSIQLLSPASVVVRWTAASDDVGVAAYQVFRDGMLLGQTALQSFSDSGLADARPYTYSVVALDLSGNASVPASVTLTTPDLTPPSMPSGLSAGVTQVGSQMNVTVSWRAASDNVGVTGYRVYKGDTPGTLRPVAMNTTTSYLMSNVQPQTTMYFAVDAVDAASNTSSLSPPVAVTIPQIADVTPPNVIVGYPASGSQTGSSTTVVASAWDLRGGTYDLPSGIAGVQFRVDGINVGPEQTVPYSSTPQYSVFRYNLSHLSRGTHVLTAVARDRAGNRAVSAGVTISVKGGR